MMHFFMENRDLFREKLGLCDLDIGLRLSVSLLVATEAFQLVFSHGSILLKKNFKSVV